MSGSFYSDIVYQFEEVVLSQKKEGTLERIIYFVQKTKTQICACDCGMYVCMYVVLHQTASESMKNNTNRECF